MERFVEGAVREAGSILRQPRRDRGRRVDRAALARDAASGHRTCGIRRGMRAMPSTRSRPRSTGRDCRTWRRRWAGRCVTASTTVGERVHAFSHLSHLYPDGSSIYATYVFRRAADPDETLERWRRLKAAASEAIVAGGGTISHQHGVGRDHAPYLAGREGRARDGGAGRRRSPVRPGRDHEPGRPARGPPVTRRHRPRARRRDAERSRPRLRSARHHRRARPRSRSSRTSRPQPGWAEQDAGDLVASDRRRLLGALGRRQRRPRRRRGADRHDAAEHDRRDRRGRPSAPTGDRLARPAPDGRACPRSAG